MFGGAYGRCCSAPHTLYLSPSLFSLLSFLSTSNSVCVSPVLKTCILLHLPVRYDSSLNCLATCRLLSCSLVLVFSYANACLGLSLLLLLLSLSSSFIHLLLAFLCNASLTSSYLFSYLPSFLTHCLLRWVSCAF